MVNPTVQYRLAQSQDYLSSCCPGSPPASATGGAPPLAAALPSLSQQQRAGALGTRLSGPDFV